MIFPKGINRVLAKPQMTNHRGRTWDAWNLTLPDGRVVNAWLDTTWGTRFYFEVDGVWRAGRIDDFKIEVGRSARFDLRDQEALKLFEEDLARYEKAIAAHMPAAVLDALSEEIDQIATAIGFNDHQRLAALHTRAERASGETTDRGGVA